MAERLDRELQREAPRRVLERTALRDPARGEVLLEDWRTDYNMATPHSAHDWLTPVEFVEAWLNRQQLQLA